MKIDCLKWMLLKIFDNKLEFVAYMRMNELDLLRVTTNIFLFFFFRSRLLPLTVAPITTGIIYYCSVIHSFFCCCDSEQIFFLSNQCEWKIFHRHSMEFMRLCEVKFIEWWEILNVCIFIFLLPILSAGLPLFRVYFLNRMKMWIFFFEKETIENYVPYKNRNYR